MKDMTRWSVLHPPLLQAQYLWTFEMMINLQNILTCAQIMTNEQPIFRLITFFKLASIFGLKSQ